MSSCWLVIETVTRARLSVLVLEDEPVYFVLRLALSEAHSSIERSRFSMPPRRTSGMVSGAGARACNRSGSACGKHDTYVVDNKRKGRMLVFGMIIMTVVSGARMIWLCFAC